MNNKEIFDNVYKNNLWGIGSGPGSDPIYAGKWIGLVNSFIKNNNVKSVLDLGCGDWRIAQEFDLDGVQYTGVDVSSFIVDKIKVYEKENIKFIEDDIVSMDLPNADLILVRDVLQHMPLKDIEIVVDKILASNSKYAIISNLFNTRKWYNILSEDDEVNINIQAGHDCTALDLSKHPFNYRLRYMPDMKINGFKQRVYIHEKGKEHK